MKKLVMIIIAFAFLAACKKEEKKECQHCTKSGAPEKELCEDQFDNHDKYHDAIDALKANGYDCHED